MSAALRISVASSGGSGWACRAERAAMASRAVVRGGGPGAQLRVGASRSFRVGGGPFLRGARRRVRPFACAVVPHPGRVPALVRARGPSGGRRRHAAAVTAAAGLRTAGPGDRFPSVPPVPRDGPRSPTTWCVTGAAALPPACCGVSRQVVVRLRLRSLAIHGSTNSTSAPPTVAAGCGCGHPARRVHPSPSPIGRIRSSRSAARCVDRRPFVFRHPLGSDRPFPSCSSGAYHQAWTRPSPRTAFGLGHHHSAGTTVDHHRSHRQAARGSRRGSCEGCQLEDCCSYRCCPRARRYSRCDDLLPHLTAAPASRSQPLAPMGRDDSAGESSEAWSDSTRRSSVASGGRGRRVYVSSARSASPARTWRKRWPWRKNVAARAPALSASANQGRESARRAQ